MVRGLGAAPRHGPSIQAVRAAQRASHAPVHLEPGLHEYDLKVDARPFYEGGRKHLKLSLGGFIVASVMLIVQN
ncbi:MAG TPA: hypothetical protein VLR71_10215 [Casimicrobiaceae bacterium]|nr:hypothetical protein [Casimicrobiaceae bacterium]